MLAELFESICQKAAAAAGHDKKLVIHGSPDPRKKYLTFGDSMEPLDVPPPIRQHEVETLDDLVLAVFQMGATKASVWHVEKTIVACLDDYDRRDTVTLNLEHGEQFSRLNGQMVFDQPQMVRFLRIEMADAGVRSLIPLFRKIDFSRSSKAAGVVQHGDESLGKSIEANVQSTAEIPEMITANVWVFRNEGLRVRRPIRLALDVDPHNGTFTLLPLADELTTALQEAHQHIHNLLQDQFADNVSVYWGKPWS